MIEQKYVSFTRRHSICGLLGESGNSSYLASQCRGGSGLEKDLALGWIVKWVWEDSERTVILLERGMGK